MGRTGESGFRSGAVAAFGGVADVVGVVVPDARRIRIRRYRNVRDGCQGFVIHHHQFGGVLRLRQRFGDDHRHGIADIAGAVHHHRRPLRREHRRTVTLLARHVRLRHRYAIVHVVAAAVDGDYTGRGRGGRCVNGPNQCVRVRRTDEHAPRLAIEGLVVLVAPPASEQAHVFQPADRLANAEFHRRGGLEDVVHVSSLDWTWNTTPLPSRESSRSVATRVRIGRTGRDCLPIAPSPSTLRV